MMIGNDTYRYNFKNVDGNGCKVEFEELVTNKKGSTESRSWMFYLSDIDPASILFNTGGKSVKVTLGTRNSQKFISSYEGDQFKEYTGKIELTLNEVDVTRKLIETLKDHIGSCTESEPAWEDANVALAWLAENIGNAKDDDVQWIQSFSTGEKFYLARISSKSVDDGKEQSFEYLFDLTDINPAEIKLEASGRTLDVQVPVREGKNYIEVNSADGRQYIDELKIYADDIEVARKMVNALTYAVSNTKAERPVWGSYEEALRFVKENMGEVKMGDQVLQLSFNFETSPSGLVELTEKETESDGESKEVTYSFYLADITDKPIQNVTRKEITLKLETIDNRNFITKTSGGSISGYASEFRFHPTNIDISRDILNAFTYAVQQSEEAIQEFASVDEVNGWMVENLVPLSWEGENYEQKLNVDEAAPNQIEFEQKLTKDGSETTLSKYLVYPEDISVDKLEITVSRGRMAVSLETGKQDYIKYFKNDVLQDFIDKTQVYFSDPWLPKILLLPPAI